jgi:3-deoxy-7-phosphoheptulonate synthase
MDSKQLINTNVKGHKIISTPGEIHALLPISELSHKVVVQGRDVVRDVLAGKDKRLFVVVGPCSIHDEALALDYAQRLKGLADQVQETMFLLMRVYFEKPRTTVGWKGYINDPNMDDSFDVEEGLKKARQLLLKITAMGVPAATEALDPISPQYLSDLMSWAAIGARTTESQTHREMASGLSMPVGFKNGTDGNIQVAINAMKSCLTSHHFLGIDHEGRISVYITKGNKDSHVVLRGADSGPNYAPEDIAQCEAALAAAGLDQKIMVDCSHGNSNKDHKNQPKVFESCMDQVLQGSQSIVGIMIESNIEEGSQQITDDLSQLKYGVSVTDKCLGWKETEAMILAGHKRLQKK